MLVILGLLVGGVLAGQSLIRAAELRSVTTELSKHKTAVLAFKDKYLALPGDMPNATAFWGQATNCTAGNGAALSGGTCNAYAANGYIGRPPNLTSWLHDRELYYAWHHLMLAGLIEGQYTGLTNHSNATIMSAGPGKNVPLSKVGNAHWCFTYDKGSVYSHPGNYANSLTLASAPTDPLLDRNCNSDASSWPGALNPRESWGVDTKIDDGLPNQGSVRAPDTYPGLCTATIFFYDTGPANALTTNAAAGYLLTQNDKWCRLVFINLY